MFLARLSLDPTKQFCGGGTWGREPGRTGAGGIRGDRRRKGGKRDLYEGEIQKGKRSLLITK